tara:strand:+ start:337 stop:792 length:456 start_codon:yes stop_codon:yes gene_type:complete
MRCFIISLVLCLFSSVNAEPKSTELLDFQLKLGQNEFVLTYLFKGNRAPEEGYLLPIPDLALLKVEFDSFEESLDTVRDFVKKECLLEIKKCQKDSHERYKRLSKENEDLLLSLRLQTKLYEEQKNKTIFYSISSVAATSLMAFIVVKAFY